MNIPRLFTAEEGHPEEQGISLSSQVMLGLFMKPEVTAAGLHTAEVQDMQPPPEVEEDLKKEGRGPWTSS